MRTPEKPRAGQPRKKVGLCPRTGCLEGETPHIEVFSCLCSPSRSVLKLRMPPMLKCWTCKFPGVPGCLGDETPPPSWTVHSCLQFLDPGQLSSLAVPLGNYSIACNLQIHNNSERLGRQAFIRIKQENLSNCGNGSISNFKTIEHTHWPNLIEK